MKKWESLSIRVKLTSAFLFTLLILFFINLFLYLNVNSMLERINEVYQSNSSLNELSETLERVQSSMEEYLSVKNTDTLEAYYQSCQELNGQLQDLNDEICGNEMLMMERNIRRMTGEYLEVADEAMQAKRGRNIERYGQKYEEASVKFRNISDWIYSLNNLQFEVNTESYLGLVEALRTFENFSLVILVLAGIANGFPMGGVIITPQIKAKYGMLGTTFGGNHLGCAAAVAVLDVMKSENCIENAAKTGAYLMEKLQGNKAIKELRGIGLMIGIELHDNYLGMRNELLFKKKIFTGAAGKGVIRLLPPLSITMEQADRFIEAFNDLSK